MNSLEFAQKMEIDGEEYYLELKDKVINKGLRTLFELLALEERKHYDMIESMMNDIKLDKDSNFIDNVKKIFNDIYTSTDNVILRVCEDALKHALSVEDESIKFYGELLTDVGTELEKEVLQIIIEEETNHYKLIENLLDHISDGIISGIVSIEFQNIEDVKL